MQYHRLHVFILFLFVSGMIAYSNQPAVTKSASAPVNEPVREKLVFDRLTGSWQSASKKIVERWSKTSDSTYRSVVYSIKGTDTLLNEQATVYLKNRVWIFETLVQGQNAGKAVAFTSTALTPDHVQFSNPAHDFPNEISYTVNDDTVHAFIAGRNAKGGMDTIRFRYTRVKE